MSFKENLLQKIEINQLTRKVLDSIGPPESGRKIDKDAMRRLLEMGPYAHRRERDLDLYLRKSDGEPDQILVLDNELPIYTTTVEDVAMRKSPYIKEMANIRNIIKILKDSDVKISIKAASVIRVQNECVSRLDLSYTGADIEAIAAAGAASLENGYAEGIIETLGLFAELLGYQPPPPAFRIRHHEIYGALSEKEGAEPVYGPAVIFSRIDNSLRLLCDQISAFDKPKIEFFQQVAQGTAKASLEGSEVFQYLEKEVLAQNSG